MGEDDITLVGSTFKPGEFLRVLKERVPCFGKDFAKTAKECRSCLAPVVVQGKLHLLREICQARSRGAATYAQLVILTTQDVIERLERGKGVEEIFAEVLGDADPDLQAAAARQLISLRLVYMKRDLGLPTPKLPPRKELLKYVRSQEVD